MMVKNRFARIAVCRSNILTAVAGLVAVLLTLAFMALCVGLAASGLPFKLLAPVVYNGVNDPPGSPVLLAPADGAERVSPSPNLRVSVSDPDGDPLEVSFYGRGPGTAPAFTLAALPDTQYYSASYPETFAAQARWIVAQRDVRNIVFVTHEGDVTNNGDLAPAEWLNASRALYLLEAPRPEIPYSIAHGNHDARGGTSQYNTWFGVSHFQDKSYYGGHYGTDNNDNFELFSASGMEFILIHLGYNPDAGVLDWANRLLQRYSNRRAIVTSHSVLNVDGSWTAPGLAIYTALKGSPNLFLILCGHNHGEAQRQDSFNGRTVYSLLADYQDEPNGGDGWLRLLEFSPAESLVRVSTYSPVLDQYRAGPASQFSFPYAMTSPDEFHLIGRQTGAASGSTISLTWPGLEPLSSYAWYASARDADFAASSTPRSFSTRGFFSYTLTISRTGGGTGRVTSLPPGIDCGTLCTAAFREDTLLHLEAAPDPDSLFSGWSGACAGQGTCSLSMDRERQVTAAFEPAPAATVITLQQGLAGYTGTVDTMILENDPAAAFGELDSLGWDTQEISGAAASRKYGLLRFDRLFGSGAGQIPPGAVILAAELQYTVFNISSSAPGSVYEVRSDWTAGTVYNTFGPAAGVQAEDYGALVAAAPGTAAISFTVDVRASLERWSLDPGANRGWIVIPGGPDGVDVRSSEFAILAERPRLWVMYRLP